MKGSLPESYAKLPGYLYMVNTINLESFIMLHKTEDNKFCMLLSHWTHQLGVGNIICLSLLLMKLF